MVSFVSFPAVSNANEDGLLAMGGDLSKDTLVSAYSQGIFPWFNDDQPVLWWSPDPRSVLYPHKVKRSRSLNKIIRQDQFHVSCNQDFAAVIRGCALRGRERARSSHLETWITESMYEAYVDLHAEGYAHSIEVWSGEKLAGGLYGVALGDVFFGESMFSEISNASKVALVGLCGFLQHKGFSLIDCQVETDHLLSMGAESIPRSDFLAQLENIDISQSTDTFHQDFNTVYQEVVSQLKL